MNRPLIIPMIALGCLAILTSAPSAQVELWTLAPDASKVQIQVGKSGLLSFAGHAHEVIAPTFAGEVRFDPQRLESAEVGLDIDAAALRVTGKGEPADDVPEVQRVMLSEKVLDTAKYPRIVFRSRQVELRRRQGVKAQLRILGDLSLHGVTRQVEAPVDVELGPTTLTAAGRLAIKQTDFGIQPVSAGLGAVKVKDEVSVQFTLVAKR